MEEGANWQMIGVNLVYHQSTFGAAKTDIEHRLTLGRLRFINPNINHFTPQSPVPF